MNAVGSMTVNRAVPTYQDHSTAHVDQHLHLIWMERHAIVCFQLFLLVRHLIMYLAHACAVLLGIINYKYFLSRSFIIEILVPLIIHQRIMNFTESCAIVFLAQTVCGANSCSHICAVVGGQDECFCPVGFELAVGSTTTCQGMNRVKLISKNSILSSYKDIDECQRFSPCDQICTNTDGSFECSCKIGFQLQNATQVCEGIIASVNCVYHHNII